MGKRRDVVVGAALLALLVLAVFGQTAGHPFVSYDDPSYITHNPVILKGLTGEGLRWAFGLNLGNWHPLAWLSHLLDVQIFGLRAGGHHLVSVLIHSASTVLLFALLRALTGSFWKSLLAAALFGVHPLRVESVAWASERKDVLATLFWLLTIAVWLGYLRRPGVWRYLGVIGVFCLGLGSKPMVMTLPAVLLLLDWWPLGRVSARPARILLLEKVPLVLLSGASLAVTLVAQTRDAMVFVHPDFPTRVANALVSVAWYVVKFVWPSGLAVLYPYPVGGVPAWESLGAGCLLVVATAAVLLAAPRYPYLPVGWFWYLATLLPVLGLFQVGAQARADRYTYVPLVGLTVAVAWSLADAAPPSRGGRRKLGAAAAAAVLLLAGAAFVQTRLWRDGITLYRHTLNVTRENPVILYNLGTDYSSLGRNPEAIAAYRELLRIDPGQASAYNNLGDISFKAGRYAEAAELFGQAVSLEPSSARARFNLGMALARLGRTAPALEQWRIIRIADADRARRLYDEIVR